MRTVIKSPWQPQRSVGKLLGILVARGPNRRCIVVTLGEKEIRYTLYGRYIVGKYRQNKMNEVEVNEACPNRVVMPRTTLTSDFQQPAARQWPRRRVLLTASCRQQCWEATVGLT